MKQRSSKFSTVVACLAVTAAVGCSDATPYSVVPVTGSVRYDDGSLIPAQQIMLTFDPMAAPVDPKTHPRKGIGYVNTQSGAIEPVTTYKYGDGVTAGKHKLLVIATDGGNNLLVPKDYTSAHTTPLVVDTSEVPLDIKVPKP